MSRHRLNRLATLLALATLVGYGYEEGVFDSSTQSDDDDEGQEPNADSTYALSRYYFPLEPQLAPGDLEGLIDVSYNPEIPEEEEPFYEETPGYDETVAWAERTIREFDR